MTDQNQLQVNLLELQSGSVPDLKYKLHPKCAVCLHPHRKLIDMHLVFNDLSYEEITVKYDPKGLTRHRVRNHKTHSVEGNESAVAKYVKEFTRNEMFKERPLFSPASRKKLESSGLSKHNILKGIALDIFDDMADTQTMCNVESSPTTKVKILTLKNTLRQSFVSMVDKIAEEPAPGGINAKGNGVQANLNGNRDFIIRTITAVNKVLKASIHDPDERRQIQEDLVEVFEPLVESTTKQVEIEQEE